MMPKTGLMSFIRPVLGLLSVESAARLPISITYLSLLYLCFNIFAGFCRDEQRGCWFVQESVSLALNICSHYNIAQLFEIKL